MLLSRLIITTYFLLIIPGVISQETNCADISNPRSAADCKLSTADKEKYDYCCFTKTLLGSGKCEAFTYEGYKDKEADYLTDESFECVHAYSGCSDIKPGKASDCVLSQEDINRKLSYCCYEAHDGEKACEAFNEKYYQDELEIYEIDKLLYPNLIFKCGNEESSSSFINISMIFLILIMMNI